MSLMNPMMGAPQPSLLGAAQNYSYPLTSGLLGAIGSHGGVGPWVQNAAGINPAVASQQAQMSAPAPDYSAMALQLAGNPHAGPYSTGGNLVQPGSATNPSAGSTSGGSTGSSVAGGLLGTLAKNPSLVKSGANLISGLLGNGLGAYGSGAAANGAVSSALGSVGAQTAPTAASIQAGNDAALSAANGGAYGAGAGLLSTGALGSGAAADAAVAGELGGVGAQTAGEAAAIQAANDAALGSAAAGSGAGAAAGGAGGAAGGSLAGAAGAVGLAALPLALAALVPYNSGMSIGEVNSMEQAIANATKANGGPINAGYAMNPDGTVNQGNAQTLNDLYTLLGDNSDEFTKAGGTGPIDQFLTGLGYGGLLSGGKPITTPAPGGRGWLGGGYTGKSRV